MADVVTYEYRCVECDADVENDGEKLPLGRECAECGGYLQHVGPVLDECDKCGAGLLYHGNSIHAFGLESVCDGCYDRIASAI